jgi:glucan endo-1,3-beta-D-glucosidase
MQILSTALIASLFFFQSTHALWKGFNLAANLPSGPCKTRGDWERDFRTLQSLPGFFSSVRLFASSDCNTLAEAVPAALDTGTTILVGVWATDAAHFNAEKQALLAAVQRYGHDWIISVSVGSEDLYRGDTSAQALADQVNDVRGMLWSVGAGSVAVGHVDTWTVWVRPENEVLIRACDFVGMDGYPYFQDSPIESAADVFWTSVNDVREVVDRVKPGTWVWITETGSPVSGPSRGPAVPSVDSAQRYWKAVACQAFREAHTFWFVLQDYTAIPSFGVVDEQFRPIYDLSCP